MVISLFEFSSAKVGKVSDILVHIPRFGVMFNRSVELPFLIIFRSQLLLLVGCLLGLFLRNSLLVLWLRLRLRFGLLFRGLQIGHFNIFLFLLLFLTRTFGGCSKLHVDAQKDTHHLQESRISHLLPKGIRVLDHSLKFAHELWVSQER